MYCRNNHVVYQDSMFVALMVRAWKMKKSMMMLMRTSLFSMVDVDRCVSRGDMKRDPIV